MNRIQQCFAQKKHHVLSLYCTAGYPKINSTLEVMKALQSYGTDIIEIGIPCNNPVADGPVIRNSNAIALQNGMNVHILFEQLQDMRKHIHIPVILMGYADSIAEFGIESFFAEAKRVGVDGVILPDVSMAEYDKQFKDLLKKNNIEFIFLITPQTTPEQIIEIDSISNSFIYAISSSHAVTGHSIPLETEAAYFKRLQQMSLKNPVLTGFGIKDKKNYTTACAYTNGAIIGSAYIAALKNSEDIYRTTKEFINGITG